MTLRASQAFAVLLAMASAGGCATARVDPALLEVDHLAIASIHARRTVSFFDAPQVAQVWANNDVGTDVIELELGETEERLAEVFERPVMPVGKALEQRVYGDLPEAWPPEVWTHVNDMIAVDLDADGADRALASLARALGVDAVVVLRHEWALERDRFDMVDGVTAYDRCTVRVVDGDGRRLWDEVVVARHPIHLLAGSGAFSVGMGYGTWIDEARQAARRTARAALEQLAQRISTARQTAPPEATRPPPQSAATPPPTEPPVDAPDAR